MRYNSVCLSTHRGHNNLKLTQYTEILRDALQIHHEIVYAAVRKIL
jgi:hypothetical protein